jgi:hypothetical protein
MLREQPDRRTAKRFHTKIAAKLVVPEPVTIQVIDVSTTGCQVEAQGELAVECRIDDGDTVHGQVVRVTSSEGKLRLGIKFNTQLTAAATAALALGRESSQPSR